MQKKSITLLLLLIGTVAYTQQVYPKQQISINGFRNPSIGLEYQRKQFSVHAGYYLTNFTSGTTTRFLKAGLTYWFLPMGKKEIPASLYTGLSVLRGLNRDYTNKTAFALEAGIRLPVWKGLSFRLGGIALTAKNESLKINPTPAFNYSITF